MSKTGIHWFRHGLRIHDNPALFACLDEVERFMPIFIFDENSFSKIYYLVKIKSFVHFLFNYLNFKGPKTCGFNRFRFLIQCLKDLEIQFAALKINFMCFYGKPHEVLEKIIKVNCFKLRYLLGIL